MIPHITPKRYEYMRKRVAHCITKYGDGDLSLVDDLTHDAIIADTTNSLIFSNTSQVVVRKHYASVRRKGRQVNCLPLDEIEIRYIDKRYERSECKANVHTALKHLTRRERAVIKLIYGIGPDRDQHTQAEVGKHFNVTGCMVGCILYAALRKLRKYCNRSAWMYLQSS